MRLLVLMAFAITFTFHSYGQIFHTKGQNILSGGISATKYSFVSRYQLDYTLIPGDRVFYKMGLSYDRGSIDGLVYNDYLVNLRYGRVIYDVKGRLFFNALGGLHVGYENFEIPDFLEGGDLGTFKEGSFIYGIHLGPEIEWFFSNKIGVGAEFYQMITYGSPLSTGTKFKSFHFHYNYAINLKYIF